MSFQTIFIVSLAAANMICIALVVNAAAQPGKFGSSSFGLLVAGVSIYNLAYILEILSGSPNLKIVWDNLQYSASDLALVGSFLFTLAFTRRAKAPWWVGTILAILIFANAVILFTDPSHHWIRINTHINSSGMLSVVEYEPGIWYNYYLTTVISLALATILIFWSRVSSSRGYLRFQNLALGFAFMIAPLGNFQSFFENTSIPDIAGLDITPVFFLAACILIWAAGFRIGAISSQTTNETIIRKPEASSNPSRPAPEEKTRAVSAPPLIKPASSLEKESIPRRERTATVAAGENLRQLVYIDRLTKLHNQRSFDENLGKEISRSTHYRHNFALLMLDLDQLDLINEKFGNSSGDEVLKTISAMAAEQVRGHDQVFRFGGEEFMILMPETPLEGASKVAERLRLQLLMQNFFDPKGNLFKATCSIGITNFVHENPAPAEKLLELADRALKIAKGKGRNQIGVVDSTTLLSE